MVTAETMGKSDGSIHTTNWPFLLKDLRGKGIILSLRTWRPDLEQVAYVLLLVLLPRLGFSKLLGSYAKNLNETQIEKQQTLFKESSGNTARDLRATGGTVSNNSSYHLGSSYGLQEEEEMVAECHNELVPNFDWQTGLCMSFSSWDALFCDAIFLKKNHMHCKLCIGASWSAGKIFPKSSLTGQFAQLHIHPKLVQPSPAQYP